MIYFEEFLISNASSLGGDIGVSLVIYRIVKANILILMLKLFPLTTKLIKSSPKVFTLMILFEVLNLAAYGRSSEFFFSFKN